MTSFITEEETVKTGTDIELLGALPEGECSSLDFSFSVPDGDKKVSEIILPNVHIIIKMLLQCLHEE